MILAIRSAAFPRWPGYAQRYRSPSPDKQRELRLVGQVFFEEFGAALALAIQSWKKMSVICRDHGLRLCFEGRAPCRNRTARNSRLCCDAVWLVRPRDPNGSLRSFPEAAPPAAFFVNIGFSAHAAHHCTAVGAIGVSSARSCYVRRRSARTSSPKMRQIESFRTRHLRSNG